MLITILRGFLKGLGKIGNSIPYPWGCCLVSSGSPIVIEHRLRISERTVAQAMFLTTVGINAVSSDLPNE